MPELLHFPHGVHAAELGAVRLVQLLVELPQLLAGGRRPAAQTAEQRGVGRRAAAEHDRLRFRVGGFKRADVLHSEEIAVVYDRERASRRGEREGVHMHRAGIHFLSRARMEDELLRVILPVDRQKARKFLRRKIPDAAFERHGNGRGGKHICEQRVERVRLLQKPRALALCRHGCRRAAEIEVKDRISHVLQPLGGPDDVRGALGEDLRHDRRGAGRLRRQLAQLPRRKEMVGRRGEKRRIVPVRAGKTARMDRAENVRRDPLHGGEIVFHVCITP